MKIYWVGKVQSRCLSAPSIRERVLRSSWKEEYSRLRRDRCCCLWVAALWSGFGVSPARLDYGLSCSKDWLCWWQCADTWHSWDSCNSKSSSRVWRFLCWGQVPPSHRDFLPAPVWDASRGLFLYIFILHILQTNLKPTGQSWYSWPRTGYLLSWELAGGWAEALRYWGKWGLWVLVFGCSSNEGREVWLCERVRLCVVRYGQIWSRLGWGNWWGLTHCEWTSVCWWWTRWLVFCPSVDIK